VRTTILVLVVACGGSSQGNPSDALSSGDGKHADSPSGMKCGTDSNGSLMDVMTQAHNLMSQRAGSGTNALAVPSAVNRDAFATIVVKVLDGDDSAACELPPSYQLIRLTDPQAGLVRVVVEQPNPTLFYGTYAANSAPTRQLVVEAPHPLFDTNTEFQATAVFTGTGARYLLVAGTHRCADAASSSCTGTTTACGASEPYRVSDAAHEDGLPFYAIHSALSTQDTSLPFLQLHGNSDTSCPEALVSDSSGSWNANDPAGRLGAALTGQGVAIGECGNGYPTAGCNLCGTDNVEARESAGAPNACTQFGTSYGRFVHVEQHLTLRTAPYSAMVAAVKTAFP
jgi:hypothetical protein